MVRPDQREVRLRPATAAAWPGGRCARFGPALPLPCGVDHGWRRQAAKAAGVTALAPAVLLGAAVLLAAGRASAASARWARWPTGPRCPRSTGGGHPALRADAPPPGRRAGAPTAARGRAGAQRPRRPGRARPPPGPGQRACGDPGTRGPRRRAARGRPPRAHVAGAVAVHGHAPPTPRAHPDRAGHAELAGDAAAACPRPPRYSSCWTFRATSRPVGPLTEAGAPGHASCLADADGHRSGLPQHLDRDLVHGQGDRRFRLGRLHAQRLGLVAVRQAVGDRGAQPLQRLVRALLGRRATCSHTSP